MREQQSRKPASWQPQLRAHLCAKGLSRPPRVCSGRLIAFPSSSSPTKDPLSFLSLQSLQPRERAPAADTLPLNCTHDSVSVTFKLLKLIC